MRKTLWWMCVIFLGCGSPQTGSSDDGVVPGPVRVEGGPIKPPNAEEPAKNPEDDSGPSYYLDDSLKLNEIQLKGSHNSYHLSIDNGEPQWAYDVPSLDVQFEYQGVRALELDVHYRDGHFGVYQLDGWEDRSTCPILQDCLKKLLDWSNAHPGHAPLIVYFEPRDTDTAKFYDYVEQFEQAIVSVWPREKAYVPDDLTGTQYPDVTSAIRSVGWPTLGKVRGKVLMVLHDFGAVRYRYLLDHGLRGRRMFVSDVRIGHPQAGFLALDEPVENEATIKEFVAKGYMVRTRADDLPTQGGDRGTKRDAALRSGAQVVLTDYPEGNYIPGYYVEMPGGKPARCNPITGPREPGGCSAEAIENPMLLKSLPAESK